MKLYMVRHGETDWNKAKKVQGRADIPLNAYGRELAEKTAEGLRGIPFDLAYTKRIGIKRRKCRGEQIFPSMHMEENWQKKQQKDCGGFLLIWRIHPLYPEQKKQHRLFYRGERLP